MKVTIDGIEFVKKKRVAYSRGDRFKMTGGNKYMLSYQGSNDDGPTVALTNLMGGCRFGVAHNVGNSTDITQKEFEKICSTGSFTRYWDIQKGELSK